MVRHERLTGGQPQSGWTDAGTNGANGAVATVPPSDPETAPRPDGRDATRRLSLWDLLGAALTALVMLGVHHAVTGAADTSLGRSPVVAHLTLGLALAVTFLAVGLVARDRPRPADLPRLVTDVWTDPPGAWAIGVLGGLLALPVLSLYTPMLLGDADSARVVAAVTHVQEHGTGFLVDTQDNLLPHLVISPVLALAGLAGAKALAVVSVQVLAAVTCWLTYRITRSPLGAVAATFALMAMPPVLERAGFVPMYPTMLALGYLGGWLAYRSMSGTGPPWWTAAGAGVCLALSPEAQSVGLLFLAVPLLMLVFAPGWGAGLQACARIYLFIAAVSIPRVVVNASSGGLERFLSYRTDYWITEGYVRRIQSDVWHYAGVDEPLGDYLQRLPGRFARGIGPEGYAVLALAIVVALAVCRGRGRALVLAVTGFMLLAVSVKQIPPFSRYYSPLWPGLAILVGVGIADLRRRGRAAGAVAGCAVAVFAVLAGSSLVRVVDEHERRLSRVQDSPYAQLTEQIDDGKGVIGARSHSLVNVTAEIPTWGGQFLTEDEYATYLTWPSDDEVIDVLDRHDIGWVLIHPVRGLEVGYHNVWLIPNHGGPARHVEAVDASPAFCQVLSDSGFKLYRLGPCPDQWMNTSPDQ